MFSPQFMTMLGSFQPNDAVADYGGGGGSIIVYFEPQYNLGSATNAAELEAVLRSYDEDMREFILQVLEEAGVDAARRAYR